MKMRISSKKDKALVTALEEKWGVVDVSPEEIDSYFGACHRCADDREQMLMDSTSNKGTKVCYKHFQEELLEGREVVNADHKAGDQATRRGDSARV